MHQYPLHSAYLTIRTNRYCRMEEYGLHTYNDCIHSYINANKHFFTGYGSEFRPWSHLKPLLLHRQNWLTLLQQLQNGSKWPLQPISDSDRCTKNTEFIARGNHKSTLTHHAILKDIITKKVQQGGMIPLPLHYINELQYSEMIAPVGIDDKQWKVGPDGSTQKI